MIPGLDQNGQPTLIPFTRVSNGFVLDNHPQNYLYYNYASPMINAGSQNVRIPASGVIPDSPWCAQGANPTRWKAISFQNDFHTHLVFRPAGGVWISLSRLTWNHDGYAERNAQGQWPNVGLPPLPGQPPHHAYPQPLTERTATM
jgi:hypothetical protein